MWPFKKKVEPPEEVAAEQKLDEVTREVAAAELTKEATREASFLPIASIAPLAPLGVEGAMPEPLEDDPDPGDEHGLRDTLRGDDEKS